MANIANNTYVFYGDKTELVKCHEKLNELYEKVGSNIICVDLTVENTVVNCEWIDYLEELSKDADSFRMDTNSKWYGNPVYWNNWVKANFSKLSVAFMCEECGMGIFEKVDPDNKFDDYVFINGSDIPEEDIAKLPQVIRDAMGKDYVCGTFLKDEVFNSKFQPEDLPESVSCEEYTNTTYYDIQTTDDMYLTILNDPKAQLNSVEAKDTVLFTLDTTAKN